MDKLARIYALHTLLQGRRTAIPLRTIQSDLDCCEASARRTIRDLRDRYGAPLEFDRQAGGWRYDQANGNNWYLDA